jgi:hypothetical protein
MRLEAQLLKKQFDEEPFGPEAAFLNGGSITAGLLFCFSLNYRDDLRGRRLRNKAFGAGARPILVCCSGCLRASSHA